MATRRLKNMIGSPVIGLVDDHAVVRLGTRVLLEDEMAGVVIHEESTCKGAEEMVSRRELDLLVVDMHLPDGHALDLLPRLLALRPGLQVLVFSVSPDLIFAKRTADLGAYGYVNKQVEERLFLEAVEAVLRGEKWFQPAVVRNSPATLSAMETDPFGELSVRELSVLNHLLDGLSLAEIARKLDLQHSSVATYKTRVLEKLGVRNLLELQEKLWAYGRKRG
ncbi:MAG: response regulator [Flavobacteriales bacterium]